MELFGIGWILRYIGCFGFIAWLFVAAIGGAIIGLHYARQNKALSEEDSRVGFNVVKFTLFPWSVWLLTFGIQFWIFYGFWWWLWFAVLAAIGSLILCEFITADKDFSLISRGDEKKLLLWVISSIAVVMVFLVLWAEDAPLVTLKKEERASYFYNLLMTEGEDHRKVLSKLEKLEIKPHPYFYAIAKAKLQQRDDAAKYFQSYADSLPAEKKIIWVALSDFFRNNFWSAEKFFKAADQDYYALWSRFRNNQLSALDLKQYAESHFIGDVGFFGKVRDVVTSTESLQNSLKEAKGSENIRLVEELQSLKRAIDDLKNIGEQSVPVYSEADRVRILRDELNADIENRIIKFAAKHAPPLPIPAMGKFYRSYQYFLNIWATTSAFSFFLLCLFGVSAIWRGMDKEIKEFFRTLAGSIGLSSIGSRLGWHSKFARSIAARLAKLEPGDEKGLFNEEIKRIYAAIFPVDILIGIRYHYRAKCILTAKHLDAQEREDILFIYRAIRKLNGKLIPHGDGQALGIITALQERADTRLQNYRKGQIGFLLARDELLMIQKEMTTLGDILDAFGEKPKLTNYHLLGLEPKRGISDAEIKQAYRSVMNAVHPDHNPNNKFVENLAKLVNGAYAALGNPNRRLAYETAIRL